MPDSSSSPACTGSKGEQASAVMSRAPAQSLPERIEALNFSMDPWECTGAALQGWATHLQHSLLPIQGYIQLPPGDAASLPAFRKTPADCSGVVPGDEQAIQEAPRRQGRASRPVSIFARAPVCQNSCTYCKACPCDVADEHDDHTCYDCEQRKLNPAGDTNAPWRAPQLPACELTCDHCSRQKCCLRYLHDVRLPRSVPTRSGGGDPCPANCGPTDLDG